MRERGYEMRDEKDDRGVRALDQTIEGLLKALLAA